jgi:hypothetical protein
MDDVFRRVIGSTPALSLFCACLVLSALFGRVVARTTIVRLAYELSALDATSRELAAELNALRTELAARRAPEQLLRDGKRFELDIPSQEQIITVTTLAPPEPEPSVTKKPLRRAKAANE